MINAYQTAYRGYNIAETIEYGRFKINSNFL